MRSSVLSIMVGVVAACSSISSARAQVPAVGFSTNLLLNGSAGTAVFGWQFTPQANVMVTALGIYDAAAIGDGSFVGDGLVEQHAIALWDIANPLTPLVSSLVPSGTGTFYENGFRYVSVSPLQLSAGSHYVIAALFGEQDMFTGDLNNPSFTLTLNPAIQFGGSRSSLSTTLAFPNVLEPTTMGEFGPNFLLVPVPEPGTLALGAVGLGLFLLASGRRR